MTATAGERRQNVADFRLTLDGEDLTGKVRPRLISLRLTEKRAGEADALELVLDDSDGKLEIPDAGVSIELSLGWQRGTDVLLGLVDKGRFVVDDAGWSSPPAQISITARSADLTAAYRVRRETSHRATTLGALARKVAAAHGLVAQVAPALASIAVPVFAQDQKSDMAMIRELGVRHDAIATVKAGRLILAPIGAGVTASGQSIPGATIAFRDGDHAVWKRAERSSYSSVEARWHDQGAATRRTEKARVAGGTALAGKGDATTKTRRLKKTYHSQADARAAASAEAGRIARKAAELTFDMALGRPDFYPDRKVSLTGFKAGIDGPGWLIAEATHALDGQGGMTTGLKLETAP